MTESLDSRKFERKAQFDVPLPIRKIQRMPVEPAEEETSVGVDSEPNTMAFSLMTKKGNRQQASIPLRCFNGTSHKHQLSGWTNGHADQDDRPTLGFNFCDIHEVAASSGKRGTTTHQEPGPEL